MKVSMIIALPFLVLASAAPAKLDERQPVDVSKVVSKVESIVKCEAKIARSIHVCFPDIVAGDPVGLTEINTCLKKLSKSSGRALRLESVPCIY
uniref:Fungal calcium binding protein domain-containing protein n=1 Tax=Gibberella zeae TaxID=5518 RepID=A0A4E9DAC0_GIBZA